MVGGDNASSDHMDNVLGILIILNDWMTSGLDEYPAQMDLDFCTERTFQNQY